MADLTVKTAYDTITGARQSPLLIIAEAHTVGSNYQVELVERPDESQDVLIPGLTPVDYAPTSAAEFQVFYRTGRVLFHADLEATEVFVTYYGWGTIIRDDHVNNIQDNLNRVEHRALCVLNSIVTPEDDITFSSGSLVFPNAALYLPNKFDADPDVTSYSITGSTETVAEGDAVYVVLTDSPGTALTIAVDDAATYAALSAATKLLAFRPSGSAGILLWNGYLLGDGGTFDGFAAKSEITEGPSSGGTLSGTFNGGYDTTTGNPSLILRSPSTTTYTKFSVFASNTVGVIGETIIRFTNGTDSVDVWLTSDGYYGTGEGSIEVSADQFLTIREVYTGGHQNITVQAY